MAAEVLNILVGSFGVVAVAPFTVLVAGLLYRLPEKRIRPVPSDAHQNGACPLAVEESS